MVIVPSTVVSHYNHIGYFSYYRPSRKSTKQRSPIHTHNQRSPLKKSIKQRSLLKKIN
ncbi:MAG: hypothetical protein IM516_05925 [Pseudanabaena sp. M158S2SP1A06QC]|nr:hypothetical protein [Pseudanabaena sp. M158S2SP1A06QC]MCA6621937.1 hypothetical protein [Pseudanabaena sp. M165S2SP1A06QC]